MAQPFTRKTRPQANPTGNFGGYPPPSMNSTFFLQIGGSDRTIQFSGTFLYAPTFSRQCLSHSSLLFPILSVDSVELSLQLVLGDNYFIYLDNFECNP